MTFKIEVTKEKIAFIKKAKDLAIFMALFTLFITNTFNASHLIKLFISFSVNVS